MKAPVRTTVTAALPYANGPLHIGHIAGAYLPADIYVRNLKARGKEVLFICGSDEHGAAITLRALKEGTTPQAIVDKYHAIIDKAFADLGIAFDIYHRTSSELHRKTSQEFFLQLHANGAFTEQTEEQYYDTQAKQFLADRYITGTCPKCGNPGAYGDQCEKCGSALSPKELIDPKSTLTGTTPELRPTKHWYLPMERSQEWMTQWINTGLLDGAPQHDPAEWKPQVLGQCNSWLKEGLRPRAMTRDLDWGVPVPLPGADGKVLYVWLDAPIGYISATKQWGADHGTDWEKWWKADDTRLLHFIGKDNIVFHCIVFPAMLKAHGGYILPENVPANEFLNLEGEKISTSRNWAVWLHEYLADFPGKEDVLRYVLCANAPETKDNDFTWKDFQARNNNELVAVLGNFVNRALVLTHKYFDGAVPACGALTDYDRETLRELSGAKEALENNIENYRFREALKEAMNIARLGNKYLADTEPWKLIKTDPERVKTILNIALQITANLSIAIEPFMPFSAKKIVGMLQAGPFGWEKLGSTDLLAAGHRIGEAVLLFEKIEDDVIQRQLDKLAATKAANASAEAAQHVEDQKETTTFDDFQKMDIRVSTILAAEKVAKTKKLLKLTVDTGIDKREIVSGIAEYYTPEELVGKQVLVLVNLEPRELKGILSRGMILMAQDASGKLRLLQPDDQTNPGATVG